MEACLKFMIAHFEIIIEMRDYQELDPRMMLTVQRALIPHIHCGRKEEVV